MAPLDAQFALPSPYESETCHDDAFAGLVCVGQGTQVLTALGDRSVETLRAGDMIVTRDHGLRAIRWIGHRETVATGARAPIRIAPTEAGGHGILHVSPNHHVLLSGPLARHICGYDEVLAPAHRLVGQPGITRAPCASVTYFHVMLDAHEIIYTEGLATESFYAHPNTLKALTPKARAGVFDVFPNLRSHMGCHGHPARPMIPSQP